MDLLAVLFGLLLRAILSAYPHSGQNDPPIYGDYEAQRHWQEVTVNLPVSSWYVNSTENDLNYWGLDYPPLTAYHSWLVGQVAKMIDPSYVELFKSRGVEDYSHRIFMRNSVLLSDLLVYAPACVYFSRSSLTSAGTSSLVSTLLLMTYPGLILIDNGHFQYNNMSLGLFIMAVGLILNSRDCLASVLFVMALSYKQMELYHALPFFFYLLGGLVMWKQSSWSQSVAKLAKIGTIVILTFAAIWWPFFANIGQVVHRIFPLARGIFEDKVANLWCCLNVFVKLKDMYSTESLALAALSATALFALPSNLLLFLRPNKSQFLQALTNTSLIFFLTSYQVHEKSILLAALPAAMWLASCGKESARHQRLSLVWFLLISVFSMMPLLIRDGLGMPSAYLCIIFVTITHYLGMFEPESAASGSEVTRKTSSPKPLTKSEMSVLTIIDWSVWTAFNFSVVGCVIVSVASVVVPPLDKYPDLWTLMISVLSAGHFLLFSIYFHYLQLCSFHNEAVNTNVSVDKKRK